MNKILLVCVIFFSACSFGNQDYDDYNKRMQAYNDENRIEDIENPNYYYFIPSRNHAIKPTEENGVVYIPYEKLKRPNPNAFF